MVENDFRVKMVAKATIYAVMLRKHRARRRWLFTAQAMGMACVLVLSVVLQTYLEIKPPTYKLDDATYGLIGESRDDTQQYLSHDTQARTFKFAVPKKQESGASAHTGRIEDAYETTLPVRAEDGITYTDTKSQIDITLMPKFQASNGKKVKGDHIVYMLSGGRKLVYTLKYNGLKEDIVVPHYTGSELDFGFDLSLPGGVEARLDGQGNIGIYSSDPTLFGDISFGSDEDRARVDKARQNGEKNHLVVTIPSPIVKDGSGKEHNDKSVFELGDRRSEQTTEAPSQDGLPPEVLEQMQTRTTRNVYRLTIASKDLKHLPYPISIDPTIQSTTASDFNNLNHEGGTEVDTSGAQIKRASLTGGVPNTWSTATRTMSVARREHCMFISNSYMYIINGQNAASANLQSTEFAPIDSDGNITAAWASTSLTTGITGPISVKCAQYNGYFYIVNRASTLFAKQNGDGTLSAWQTTTGFGALNDTTDAWSTIVANGYIYMAGGLANSGSVPTRAGTGYAKINADGSLSAWTAGPSLATAVHKPSGSYYNGWLYIAGGFQNGGLGGVRHVQRAKVNADGSFGSWIQQANILTTVHFHISGDIFGGYLYLLGGSSGSPSSMSEYGQVLADGSIGTMRTTTSLPAARYDGSDSVLMHNDKIYISGGCSNGTGNCTTGNTHLDGIYYTSIKPAGELHNEAWSSGGDISLAREGMLTTVYNGYIYAIGGCSGSGCSTVSTTVDMAPLNADGSIGTWTTTTSLATPGARSWGGVVAHNGFMYYVGGCTAISSGNCTTRVGTTLYASINANGTLNAWSTDSTNPLNTTRALHGATVYNGRIYVAGGVNGGVALSSTEYASINSGGDLGSWTTGTTLNTGRLYTVEVVHDGYLYVLGGTGSGGGLSSVEYAQIDSNGVPGSWVALTSMGSVRVGLTAAVHNGYLYAYGGDNGSTPIATVEYTKLNADGTLAGWNSTQSMSTARFNSTGTASNGVLYAIGGFTGASFTASTEYQYINNGGSGATSWLTDSSGTMNTARYNHVTVAAQGRIYALGGCTTVVTCGTNPTASVESAPVNTDGTLGTWRAEASLPAARNQQAGITHNGYIYLSGGKDSANSGVSDVHYAKLNSDGTLASDPDGGGACATTWCAQTNFANFRVGHRHAVVNDYLYAISGDSGEGDTTVRYAAISTTDGSVGTWSSTASLPDSREFSSVVVNRNTIYITGGSQNNTNHSNITYYTQPAGNGTISTWDTSAQRLANARHTHGGAVLNGYIYVFGGWNGSATVTATEYAPILPGGDIGQWQTTTSLPEARDGLSGAVWNGVVYSPAGNNNGTLRNNTQYASLQSIPRTGSFSKRYDFDVGVKPTKLITRGTKQGGAAVNVNYSSNVSCNNTALDNAQSALDIGYAGANALSLSLGTSRTLARCFFLRYTIDDQSSAVFPDSGNESTISGFDIYYTANPGQRLRGGRTFTNGADRGLDAAPQ